MVQSLYRRLYHFFMLIYTASALLNTFASFLLGTVLVARKRPSKVFLLYSLFAFCVGFWSLFYYLWLVTEAGDQAFLYTKIFLAFAAFIPSFFLHFVSLFTRHKLSPFVLYSGYLISAVFSYLSFTDLMISGVESRHIFQYWPIPGNLFSPFLVFWFFYTAYSLYILIKIYYQSSPRFKVHIKYISIGTSIGFLGGATNFFLWYEILVPPVGNFLVTVYVVMTAVAVVRHNLFNIRLIYAETLILSTLVLLTSLLFLPNPTASNTVVLVTIITFAGISSLLLNSIHRSEQQKLEVEKLMTGLARANKRLHAIDKQKSEFVSIASHQLRSPLTAIRGYASMLLEGSFGKFPKKAHNAVEHIEESARMMAMSIEDYLNVSRIESGNMKFDCEDFNLKELASTVTDDLRSEATKSGLVLSFKSDLESKSIVHADKGKVQQILHNLINNSLKYTPKGSITVYLHDDPKKGKVHVEIIDTGIGMSKETQSNIFSKFQRAKEASTVNVHGTGLGLFVAKKMAVEMDGDVTAYSEGEGRGSHFILELPLQN